MKRYINRINPNESDFVKSIRCTHCKGCLNENGYCSACSVLDCWLRKTYLPAGVWEEACQDDIEWKLVCEISDSIDEQILVDIKNKLNSNSKVYCIEEWIPEEEKCRDGWHEDSWKNMKTPIDHEFDNEEEFKTKLLDIINNGGVISKVYIKKP